MTTNGFLAFLSMAVGFMLVFAAVSLKTPGGPVARGIRRERGAGGARGPGSRVGHRAFR